MSILESAYAEILAGFRNWPHMHEQSRFANFQLAYSLIGKPFSEALTQLERAPQDLSIFEGEVFVSLTLKNRKYLLFRNSANTLTGLDCTCELSWRRKAKGDASLLCVHELLYELSRHVFREVAVEEEVNELSELLHRNR